MIILYLYSTQQETVWVSQYLQEVCKTEQIWREIRTPLQKRKLRNHLQEHIPNWKQKCISIVNSNFCFTEFIKLCSPIRSHVFDTLNVLKCFNYISINKYLYLTSLALHCTFKYAYKLLYTTVFCDLVPCNKDK